MTDKYHDFGKLINNEHREAEILRLRKGLDGCGCSECQEYYKTLELGTYGDREKRYSGLVTITAGRTGADLYDDQRDHWVKSDSVLICDGKGYAVTRSGGTVCMGPVSDDGNVLENVTTALTITEQEKKPVTAPSPDTFIEDNGVTVEKPDAVTTKIRELATPGKSCRTIEKELADMGIFVSYRTIARRLQGVLI